VRYISLGCWVVKRGFTGSKEANHAVGVVVGGFVGLELVHARVAFSAHFACEGGLAISYTVWFSAENYHQGNSSQ
jgi:hypothetical protein